jgi:phosphoribosylamine--glycine ligase
MNNNNHTTYTPKKFLFVSKESLSGDLAWQIKKEGNEVKAFIESEEDKDVYDGILDKADNWAEHIGWADVVVFDDTGFGEAADKLRKEGKLVVGGSLYTDKLEEDRKFGQDELKKAGINNLTTEYFSDYNKAIEYLKENPGRYVFKPCGAISSAEKDLLFIGKEEDGLDLIEVLAHNKKAWSKKIQYFQLQKFVSGVEIACGTFFNGKEFIYPVNINFEHKRLFPGDIGPLTGEMGTLMFWDDSNHPLFKATLEKIKEPLVKSGYVGYIDLNCIVNAKGVYPLEFTSRFGYPTISIQMEGISTLIGEFLYRLAKGENFTLKTKKGFQIGVVVAIPPFPFDDKNLAKTYKDSSILFKRQNLEGIHIGDVKIVDNDWHVAGDSGYAVVVTGSGGTVDEARLQAYSRIKNIILMNMFYRTDIGKRWSEDSDKLQTWGYF